jgi:hypothetical protein
VQREIRKKAGYLFGYGNAVVAYGIHCADKSRVVSRFLFEYLPQNGSRNTGITGF